MIKFIQRWRIFCQERFSLGKHSLLIVFYVSANASIAFKVNSLTPVLGLKELLCTLTVFAIFFHLRIFDEIKDYEHDIDTHTQRPLARGLISLKEAKAVAFILIFLELVLSFFIGRSALIAAVCTVLYSLVMYKEFFIGTWLRPRMATYAMSHTLVSCWMSVYVYSAVTDLNFLTIVPLYGLFVAANWMIFNIFEFGRKTFGKDEEKDLIESYSKRLGPQRAALNVVIMATIALFVANTLSKSFQVDLLYVGLMYVLYTFTLLFAGLYAVHNDRSSARMFRGICSIFILFYNVIITLGILLEKRFVWIH